MKSLLLLMFLLSPLNGNYFIAIKKNEGDVLNNLDTFRPLMPPKGKYYADPFLFKYEETNYIFFEDYNYKKGVISYVTLDQDGKASESTLALELPTHLSFPFIFSDNGTIYMMPETYYYKSISLYRAVDFPYQWELDRVLIRGERFSDPILFKHDGYYWLFTAIDQDRLQIYYAKDLNSRFLPHPINRRRIRGRNAGPVYTANGRLIRPTMDCSKTYGRSMILKEILTLSTKYFIEVEIATIEPTWAPGLIGTHTYCLSDDYVVYDGQTLTPFN